MTNTTQPITSGDLDNLRHMLGAVQEQLGKTCADGGTCHHFCETECFRKSCCGPLAISGLNDDWTSPQPAIKETVQEVPFNPTDEMVNAGKMLASGCDLWLTSRDAKEVWQAMYKASSQPASEVKQPAPSDAQERIAELEVVAGDGIFAGCIVHIDESLPSDIVELRGANRVRLNIKTGKIEELTRIEQEKP